MKRRVGIIARIILAFGLIAVGAARAQDPPTTGANRAQERPNVGAARTQDRPRVGVALGGGAAKGLAHIGVLQVLEEVGMPIDCITGVSMGSIVAGMYAVGYSPSELESIVVHVDWTELFSDREGRRMLPMEEKARNSRHIAAFPLEGAKVRLQSGLIEGKNIGRFFSQLALPYQRSESFEDFPTPFACVATDIMTGDAIVLDKGFLAEAIRASMAIPTVFSPVKIEGRLLVDGGLARLLPASDVRDLGAEFVIGVDVGKREYTQEELNSFITISNQALNLMLDPALEKEQRLCDILIKPDMEGVALSDFRNAGQIIERGREAARAILPKLKSLADSLNALSPGGVRRQTAPMRSVYLTDVSIQGFSGNPKRVIEKEIGIKTPRTVEVEELADAIGRLRGSQLFDRVNSRIEENTDQARLVLELREKKTNTLGVGLRYDTRRDASLLADATFRRAGFGGATLAVDAVVREEYGVEAKYTAPIGLMRAFGLRVRADASRALIGVFERGQRVAMCRSGDYFGEVAVGTLFSTRASVSGGIRGEYLNYGSDAESASLTRGEEVLLPYYGMIMVDTFDRTVYPRRGVFAQLVAERTEKELGSDVSFSRVYLDWRAVIPVNRRVSFLQNLYLGRTYGDDIPPAYVFFLGGVDEKTTLLGKETSFYGLKHQERGGRHIQTFHLGVQWDAFRERYVILVWNVGNTFDEWHGDFKGDRYINGVGLTLGIDTILGPIEATVMTSERNDFLVYFNAGYKF